MLHENCSDLTIFARNSTGPKPVPELGVAAAAMPARGDGARAQPEEDDGAWITAELGGDEPVSPTRRRRSSPGASFVMPQPGMSTAIASKPLRNSGARWMVDDWPPLLPTRGEG
jgi:hypothetical protein